MSTLSTAQMIELLDGDVPAFYTGIGSRQTPNAEMAIMTTVAKYLAQRNRVLRSGGAVGADSAFEYGCDQANGEKEIYLAWPNANGRPHKPRSDIVLDDLHSDIYIEAAVIAEKIHPNWSACTNFAQLLHTRNVLQILGRDLKSPSSMVICWTENGRDKGGTATAIKLARQHEIPVINIGDQLVKMQLMRALSSIRDGLLQEAK